MYTKQNFTDAKDQSSAFYSSMYCWNPMPIVNPTYPSIDFTSIRLLYNLSGMNFFHMIFEKEEIIDLYHE